MATTAFVKTSVDTTGGGLDPVATFDFTGLTAADAFQFGADENGGETGKPLMVLAKNNSDLSVTANKLIAVDPNATTANGDAANGGFTTIYTSLDIKGALTAASQSIPSLTVTGNATVEGNLTVNGTTTSINTEDITIEDNNISLAATDSEVVTAVVDNGSAGSTFTYDFTFGDLVNVPTTFVAGEVLTFLNFADAMFAPGGASIQDQFNDCWVIDSVSTNVVTASRDFTGGFAASQTVTFSPSAESDVLGFITADEVNVEGAGITVHAYTTGNKDLCAPKKLSYTDVGGVQGWDMNMDAYFIGGVQKVSATEVGTAAANFTDVHTAAVTGATGLTLEATTDDVIVNTAASGGVAIAAGTAVPDPAAGQVDIDANTNVTIDAATTASLTGGTGTTVAATTGALTLDAVAANVDIDAATSLTMDSGTTTIINGGTGVTVAATTGELDLTSAAANVDINAVTGITMTSSTANVDVDAATTLTLDAGTTAALTGATGTTVAATTGTLTLDAVAADVDIDAGTSLTVDSGTTLDIAAGSTASLTGATGTTITATTGELDLTATAANVDINAGTSITVDSATSLTLTGGSTAALTGTNGTTITATTNDLILTAPAVGSGGVGISAGTAAPNPAIGQVDIDANTTVTIDAATTASLTGGTGASVTATTGVLLLDAVAANIDMDAATDITMTAGTTAALIGGTGASLTANANDVDIQAAGTVDIDATAGAVEIDAGTNVTITGASGINLFKATTGAVGLVSDASGPGNGTSIAAVANSASSFAAVGGYENVWVWSNNGAIANAAQQKQDLQYYGVNDLELLYINTGQQPTVSNITGNGATVTVTVATGLVDLTTAAQGTWAVGNSIVVKGTTNYDGTFTIATITFDNPNMTITYADTTNTGAETGFIKNTTALLTVPLEAVGIGKVPNSGETPTYILDIAGSARGIAFVSTSDQTLKSNVETIAPAEALEIVNKLRPVRHDWKREENPDRKFPAGRQVGFLAQEVREVIPEVVVGEQELAVEYGKVVAMLTAAVQDLSKQVAELKSQVNNQFSQ